MSVSVTRYYTTKFILKSEDSVAFVQKLVEQLQNPENLYYGYTFAGFRCGLLDRGERAFSFWGGEFADSSPVLKAADIPGFAPGEEVDLFAQIQEHLAPDEYFFVEQHSVEGYALYSHTMFYHQNGDFTCISNPQVEENILQKYKSEIMP